MTRKMSYFFDFISQWFFYHVFAGCSEGALIINLYHYADSFSTESALLKVTNDILPNLELKKSILYIGIALSAAFDTVDHDIFLSILDVSIGLRGSLLCFLTS